MVRPNNNRTKIRQHNIPNSCMIVNSLGENFVQTVVERENTHNMQTFIFQKLLA